MELIMYTEESHPMSSHIKSMVDLEKLENRKSALSYAVHRWGNVEPKSKLQELNLNYFLVELSMVEQQINKILCKH